MSSKLGVPHYKTMFYVKKLFKVNGLTKEINMYILIAAQQVYK